MKLNLKASFAAALLVLASCGGSAMDSLKSDTKSTMTDMVSALEGIKDKASAEAAVGDLTKAIAGLSELAKRGEELSDEDKKAFEEAGMETDMEALTSKMATETMRVMTIEGVAEVLGPVMTKMGQ